MRIVIGPNTVYSTIFCNVSFFFINQIYKAYASISDHEIARFAIKEFVWTRIRNNGLARVIGDSGFNRLSRDSCGNRSVENSSCHTMQK